VADDAGAPTGAGDGEVAGRRVLAVAGVAVALVLGAAILTSVLPADLQRVIFHTPLLIGILLGGTALVLWRVAARRSTDT